MLLNYSDIPFDSEGRVEMPELMLRTLHGETIGLLHGAAHIEMDVKLSEPSELRFDLPSLIDGAPNPDYDRVTGHKQIYTAHFGIYETLNPSVEDDGTGAIKHVTAYSLEKALSSKRFFLEEGTYVFWNPALPDDTVLGRIIEKATGWTVGYVSPSLFNIYRTFEQVDDELLHFAYNTLDEKYLCCVVFDTYNKTINVYDRNVDLGTLPIYLDHDNLIDKLNNEEKSEELVTALRPTGADGLSIREVNPTGSAWIYDLTNFIENGDLPASLATKWRAWEAKIAARREYYIALISLRASTSARLLSEQAKLADLNGELETLNAERNAIVQALGMATAADQAAWQAQLTAKTAQVSAKQTAITAQATLCSELEDLLDASKVNSYTAKIQAVVDALDFTNTDNFTATEQAALQHYFIEGDLSEETFVATDIDTTISGQFLSISAATTLSITDAVIARASVGDGVNKTVYSITGGTLTVSGGQALSGQLIGGTVESGSNGSFVLSAHCGSMTVNSVSASNLMVTLNGTYTAESDNVASQTVDGITLERGTSMTLTTTSAAMYVTATTSAFQQFTVQRELYDFAVNELKKLATYTYEFSIDAANFLFSRQFDPFRNALELGKGIYLNVDGVKVVTPLIEMSFEFDDEAKMNLVFSNRVKRHDPVNTLKDVVEKSYSTTRSIEAGKHIQGLVNDQATTVSQFMNSALDAAKNRILAAGNQSVVIDGAGIHIGETTGANAAYQMAIVNNMIAMTDDNWAHAKLAAGLFRTPDNGTSFGINAEVISGKLIVGNAMVIEAPGTGGVMQFKVDGSGAWMDNGRLVMRNNAGGRMLIDPTNGIVAGKYNSTDGDLFTVDGTTVTPSYLYTSGTHAGEPKPNVSFMLDITNGDAYFAGTLAAKAGEIGGFTIENNYLHSGTGSSYVELNGGAYDVTSNPNGQYAIVVGNSSPGSAKFWVKKDGSIYGNSAEFQNSTFKNGELVGPAIYVPNKTNPKFYVDANGNVTLAGTITWSSSSKPWSGDIPDVSSFITSSDAHTIISSDLVASPRIVGASIEGASYFDVDKRGKLDITSTSTDRYLYFGVPNGSGINDSSFYIHHDNIGSSCVLYLAGNEILSSSSSVDSASVRCDLWLLGALMGYGGITYGSLAQRDQISNPHIGRIFFVI